MQYIFVLLNENGLTVLNRTTLQVDCTLNTTYSKSDRYIPLSIMILLSLYDISIDVMHISLGYVIGNQTVDLIEILKRNIAFHIVILMANVIDYYNIQLSVGLRRRFTQLNELLQMECEAFGGVHKQKRTNHQIVSVQPACFSRDQKLSKLRQTYLILTDGASILNDFLGPNSLFGILSATVLLVVSPYYTILVLQGKRTGMFEKVFRVFILLKSIMRVIIVIEPWHACTPQVKVTQNLVCKLLSMNTDSHYRKEVRLFGVVLGLRQIKFTACDLFNVDRLLYSSIIGTITTSLVVLLQAEESEIDSFSQSQTQ